MTTKLTLSVEEKVIQRAKVYAKKTGRSLSEIVELYLESITADHSLENEPISPKLRKLIGSVKLPKNFNEEKSKREYLEKKYLK